MRRHELAHRAWPILCRVAQEREMLTYEELARHMGYEKAATTMKNALGPIQNFCIARGLPPLTAIVVSKQSKKPGGGFIPGDDTISASQLRTWNHDWSATPPPTLHQLQLVSNAPIREEHMPHSEVEHAPVQRPWHWEGNVQEATCRWLEVQNWTIRKKADTAARTQGVDIIAERDGQNLWVSVKGYPVATERTQPALQARHWFASAIFDVVLYRGESEARLAIALPEGFKTFQTLARRANWLRQATPFSILWVSQEGSVREES